jgi:hypothetical protein
MKVLATLFILIITLKVILGCIKSIDSNCCNPQSFKCCCYDEDGKSNIVVNQALGFMRGYTQLFIVNKITSKMDCKGCELGFKC